jgi:hypothetical protein
MEGLWPLLFLREGSMIAKYNENSYIDVDSITFIRGEYEGEPSRWFTTLVVGGVEIRIYGKDGKNIMDSFIWKWNNATYNMIPSSSDYKQVIKVGRK